MVEEVAVERGDRFGPDVDRPLALTLADDEAARVGGALVLGLSSWALVRHRRERQMVAWLAVIGLFGSLTEFRALL